MLGIEDIKYLGGIILHISEIFSRQSINKLPTDVIMLREDLDIKKEVIEKKVEEANGEFLQIQQEVQKLYFNENQGDQMLYPLNLQQINGKWQLGACQLLRLGWRGPRCSIQKEWLVHPTAHADEGEACV